MQKFKRIAITRVDVKINFPVKTKTKTIFKLKIDFSFRKNSNSHNLKDEDLKKSTKEYKALAYFNLVKIKKARCKNFLIDHGKSVKNRV